MCRCTVAAHLQAAGRLLMIDRRRDGPHACRSRRAGRRPHDGDGDRYMMHDDTTEKRGKGEVDRGQLQGRVAR